MSQEILSAAVANLLQIPPLIHRSVRQAIARLVLDNPEIQPAVTKQQFEILNTLDEEGTLQVAEIGKKLYIAKAQMTQLLDKLSKLGLIEKKPSSADRRAIDVSLSAHGRTVLVSDKEKIRQAVVDVLSKVSDDDLLELSASLQKVRDIVSRIE